MGLGYSFDKENQSIVFHCPYPSDLVHMLEVIQNLNNKGTEIDGSILFTQQPFNCETIDKQTMDKIIKKLEPIRYIKAIVTSNSTATIQ